MWPDRWPRRAKGVCLDLTGEWQKWLVRTWAVRISGLFGSIICLPDRIIANQLCVGSCFLQIQAQNLVARELWSYWVYYRDIKGTKYLDCRQPSGYILHIRQRAQLFERQKACRSKINKTSSAERTEASNSSSSSSSSSVWAKERSRTNRLGEDSTRGTVAVDEPLRPIVRIQASQREN